MIIDPILKLMVAVGGTDMFFSTNSIIYIRVRGDLYPINDILTKQDSREGILYSKPLANEKIHKIAKEIMGEGRYDKFLETREDNLALFREDIGRFRVNVFFQRGSVCIAVRYVTGEVPSIDELELPVILKDICTRKRGLVLVCGATETGKSTTVAAMVNEINESQCAHIITVEDPIEYFHPQKKCLISQREVGIDTSSFNQALRNAMRQSPDIIVVGEIRDKESLETALSFSETGHLCLATMHANNAYQAIQRVVNLFDSSNAHHVRNILSQNLVATIAQRLVKGTQGGRVAAVEVMIDSALVKDKIKKGEDRGLHEVIEGGAVVGMQTFDQHLFDLYKIGKITQEEALTNAESRNNLRINIKLNSKSDDKDILDEFLSSDLGFEE